MKICLKTLGIEIKKKELIPLLNEMFKKGIKTNTNLKNFIIYKKKIDEKEPKKEIEEQFYLLCNY